MNKVISTVMSFICSFSLWAQLAHVGVEWDANPETTVIGYRVYYTIDGSLATNVVETSNTKVWINNLIPELDYTFTITAYDEYNQESDPSNPLHGRGNIPIIPVATNEIPIIPVATNEPPVIGANRSPELPWFISITNAQNSLVQFIIPAYDADYPKQQLTYSLEPVYGEPTMNINLTNGMFSWYIGDGYAGYRYNMRIWVIDNGNPPMSNMTILSVNIVSNLSGKIPTAPVGFRHYF